MTGCAPIRPGQSPWNSRRVLIRRYDRQKRGCIRLVRARGVEGLSVALSLSNRPVPGFDAAAQLPAVAVTVIAGVGRAELHGQIRTRMRKL